MHVEVSSRCRRRHHRYCRRRRRHRHRRCRTKIGHVTASVGVKLLHLRHLRCRKNDIFETVPKMFLCRRLFFFT